MPNLRAGKKLEVFYQSEALPTALVVSIGKESAAARDGARGLEALKASAGGRELLGIMGIQGFAPVNAAQLENLKKRYQWSGAARKEGPPPGEGQK